MSTDCHLFCECNPEALFRVTVDNIVNATLAFDTSALAFTSEFQLAGARCIFSTNVRELRDNSLNWRAVSSPSSSETFEMEILVDPHVRFDSAAGARA